MITEKCSIMSNRENEEVFMIKYLPDNKIIDEVVIAIHGFGSTKHSDTITMLAEKISEHGYAVFALDLPAHGESKTEILTIDKAINYLLDLEDYIKQEYKEAKIGYFASSFGAYLTLLRLNKLENEEEIDKVVLRCSAIDMKNIFKNNLLDEGYEKFEKQGYADLGFARKVHCTKDFLSDLENQTSDYINSEEKKTKGKKGGKAGGLKEKYETPNLETKNMSLEQLEKMRKKLELNRDSKSEEKDRVE